MPKITIQVEQFTRRDGTVVRAHEREIDVPSLSGENRVKLDDFIQSIGIGTSSFNPVDTASEVSTLESIISDGITEKTASSSESERLSLNEEEIYDLLDNLIGNELEEDQLNIPQFNEDTDNFIFQIGTDAYLYVRNREELPSSGPFEITITDVNDEHIGYMRGTKGGDEISFNLVHLNEDSRGFGIGKSIYQEFLNRGNTILSDTEITEGTEALYKSLNRDGVDIFNKDGRALLKLKPEKIKDPTLIEASAADRLVDIQGTGGALSQLLSSSNGTDFQYLDESAQSEKIKEYTHVGEQLRTVWVDWFLGEAVENKSRIAFEIDQDKELESALKSSLYDIWKEREGSDISFNDFLNSDIELYRGISERNEEQEDINENGFTSWTTNEDVARSFGNDRGVVTKTIPVKDLYGAVNIVGGEVEVLEKKPYSEEFSNRLFNEKTNEYGALEDSQIEELIETKDNEGSYAAYLKGEEFLGNTTNQDAGTFDSIVNAIAEDSGFTKQQVGEFLRDAGVQKNDLPADSEFLGTVPIGGFAPDSENFKRWSRGYKIHGDQDFLAADGRTGEPFVVEAYHGTTHDFYQFNAGEEGEIKGFLGSQNYFTTSYSDASQNYGATGADLANRIEERGEEILQTISDQQRTRRAEAADDDLSLNLVEARQELKVAQIGLRTGDVTEEEHEEKRARYEELQNKSDQFIKDFIEDISSDYGVDFASIDGSEASESLSQFARHVAGTELSGDNEQVMELYIRADNPIFINAVSFTKTENIGQYAKTEFIDVGLEFDEDELNDAWEEVKLQNDLTDEDREDWQWDIEAQAREWSYSEPPLVEALSNALRKNEYDSSLAYEILGDLAYESEISNDQLNSIRAGLSQNLFDNDSGELASSEVFAQTLFNLGFDAIVLRDSDAQFRGLTSDPGTSHIHLPDNHNNQIKLRDGRNTNFAESPDIRDRTESNAPSFRDWLSQENKEAFIGKSLKEILRSPEGRAALEDYKRVWRRNLP